MVVNLKAVEQLGLGLRRVRSVTVATYALLIYEFLIMLDREYKTIYKSRWSLSKCLYLGSRFGLLFCWPIVMYALVFDHDEKSCKPFLVIVSVIFALLPCPPQCLYVLRAYAITGAKRWSLVIYLPCLFADLFVTCWYSLKDIQLSKQTFQILRRTGCFPVRYDDFSRALFAIAGLDGVIGLMLVIHFIRLQGPQTRLGKLLITQSILYFLVMFLLYVGAGVVSSVGVLRTYAAPVLYALLIIPHIMACRFIIQIKESACNNPNSPEVASKVRREVERAFPARTLPRTDSLALHNIQAVPSKV